MATQMEKRAKLEARLAKLDPEKVLEAAEKRRESVERRIADLQKYRDLEGRKARFALRHGVYLDVVIIGYERSVYSREMFRVTNDGKTSWMTSRSKLYLDGEQTPEEQAAEEEAEKE